jgi:hypothetical protein
VVERRLRLAVDVAFADAIDPALLVLLETLAPAERLAFVLRGVFELPFAEIAPLVDRPRRRGCSPAAPDTACTAPRPLRPTRGEA